MRRRHSRSRTVHRRRKASRRFGVRRRLKRFSRRHSKVGRKQGGLWSLINKIAPPIAFLDQINDTNRADYQGKDMFTKVKILANSVTGKVLNFNAFGDVKTYSQNINPAGIANKYTAIGIASILGAAVLPKLGLRIPLMGRAFSVGKKLLPAGILGGLFDDPVGYSHATYFSSSTVQTTNPTLAQNGSLSKA